jgi:hypothetical protein
MNYTFLSCVNVRAVARSLGPSRTALSAAARDDLLANSDAVSVAASGANVDETTISIRGRVIPSAARDLTYI